MRISRRVSVSLLGVLSAGTLLFANIAPVLAVDVQYDNSFSGDGYHIVDGSPYITNEVSYDIAVQSDGKPVVSGAHIPDTTFNQEGTIRRFNADGSADSSFGVNGLVSLDIGTTGTTQFDAIAIQGDGKIIVSGEVINNSAAPDGYDRDAIVVRLTSTGALDTSFSSDGYEVYDSLAGTPYLTDNFRDISIDSEGNIILAGSSGLVGVVVRLTTSGIFDTSFSSDGIAVIDIGGQDLLSSVTVDSSDSVYATGYSSSTSQDLLVVKLSSTGVLDTGFSGDGFMTIDSLDGAPSSSEHGMNIEIDGSNLVVAGMTSVTGEPLSSAGFIARLTSGGILDMTFSSDGVFVLPDNDWIEGLKVSGDYYYAVGADFVSPIGMADSSIWRLTRSGVMDTDFNSNGQLKLLELNYFSDTWGILYGIEVTDGEIFVAGTPFNDADFAEVSSIAKIVFGNEAVNIPTDTVLTNDTGTPISVPLSGIQTVRIESTVLDIPVVEFSADFTDSDLDLSGVVVDSSVAEGKAVVSGLSGVHSIFIPKRVQDNSVIICPDAHTLDEVFEGCTNQQTYDESDPNVEIVNIGGQDFWKVSGLTGTGGLGTTIVLGALSPTGQGISVPVIVLGLILIVLLINNRKYYRQSL